MEDTPFPASEWSGKDLGQGRVQRLDGEGLRSAARDGGADAPTEEGDRASRQVAPRGFLPNQASRSSRCSSVSLGSISNRTGLPFSSSMSVMPSLA